MLGTNLTPTSEEWGKFCIKPSESLTPRWDRRHCSRHKTEWNEGMKGRDGQRKRRLKRWECSYQSWRGAAGRCTLRSRQCSCTLAPSAWRRRRKHWSGTGWGRPACSASPGIRKEEETECTNTTKLIMTSPLLIDWHTVKRSMHVNLMCDLPPQLRSWPIPYTWRSIVGISSFWLFFLHTFTANVFHVCS